MIEATGEGEEGETKCLAHSSSKIKGAMTDTEVLANCIGFLIAGNEATATALSFASYLLALHPEIQEKLQLEIDTYFDENPVSYKKNCVYVHLCIK